MTTYTETFGGQTVEPSQLSYRAVSLTANIELVWPLDATSDAEVAAQIMDVSPTNASPVKTITLPDARLVSPGQQILFFNPSAFAFSILRKNQGFQPALTTVGAGKAVLVYLTNNSTELGTWRVIQYGIGTSAPDAATLQGLGVQAISTTLNWASDTQTKNANYTLIANDRATTVISTGGAITFAFTAAATLTDGWIVLIRNEGSGSLTLDPNGAETIDGAATKILAATESCLVVCDGSNLHTVGYGRSVTSTVSAVNISLAGTGTYTESSSETAAQVQNFTGLLTGNRIVEFGTAAGYWFIYNNTTGAFTVTCRVDNLDAGAAITQGNYSIIRSDGTNLRVAFSATVGTITSVATGTGLTGGPITTTGTISLANTTATPGTYGSATKAMTGTVDAQGRLTASGEATITPAFSSLTGTPTTLAGYGITDGALNTLTLTAGTGLSGGGDLTANRSFSLANTAVVAGAYTNLSATIDAQGRITAASSGTAPVTSVSGSAPIASSGGATPTISHNTSGVVAAAYANPSLVTVDATGHVTAITAGSQPQIVVQCSFNGATGALIGSDVNVSTISGGGTATFVVNFSSAIASDQFRYSLSTNRSPGNSQTTVNLTAWSTTSVTISCTAQNSGDPTISGANATFISLTIWL